MDSYFIDLMKMVLTLSHREERKPNTRGCMREMKKEVRGQRY